MQVFEELFYNTNSAAATCVATLFVVKMPIKNVVITTIRITLNVVNYINTTLGIAW